ncbi:hypothetical protein F4779DRAFT_608742 [Xylariaceae sp. FL0662B]|nr:hypothetical protein F4779DRAFT_608742 [Xylariaceae sp. FL0662B]
MDQALGIWEPIASGSFTDQPEVDESREPQLNIVILEAVQGHTSVGFTRNHFQWLLDKYKIPISSARSLFRDEGQPTHTVEYSRVGQRELPVSLCISVQTPTSIQTLPPESESLSLLLRISVQTNSATCIVVVRNPTSGGIISRELQSHYQSIRSYPLHVLNVLCRQLGQLSEGPWKDRARDFKTLRKRMHAFCTGCEALYKDGGMAVYMAIHNLGIQRDMLMDLGYATSLELSTLRYAQIMGTKYQEMRAEANKPQFPRALLEIFRRENQVLETAAQSRQIGRQELEKRAELYEGILRSSNSQHGIEVSLDDSVAIKMISFITLFFLPLSLVATISGSNAFDFNKYDAGRDVLTWHYWWILIVIAGGLTVTSFLVYYLYMRWNGVVKTEPQALNGNKDQTRSCPSGPGRPSIQSSGVSRRKLNKRLYVLWKNYSSGTSVGDVDSPTQRGFISGV